jgi:hypothetical protein
LKNTEKLFVKKRIDAFVTALRKYDHGKRAHRSIAIHDKVSTKVAKKSFLCM